MLGQTRVKAALRKNVPHFKTLFLGRYPRFVYPNSSAWDGRYIPVFVFHEVNPQMFARQLEHLKDNGYGTVDCTEWRESMKRPFRANARKVLLTFDDGHISLWQTAYPLLSEYGFKAVSFVCPGLIPDRNNEQVEDEKRNLCNWEEIREMQMSGAVDFQSHGLYHDLVFTGAQVRGFFSPAFVSHYTGSKDVMSVVETSDGIRLTTLCAHDNRASAKYLGLPMFDLAPRFSTDRCFEPSERVVRHMLKFVADQRGLSLYKKWGWTKKLSTELTRCAGKQLGAFASGPAYQERLIHDLQQSKRIIEEKLPGAQVEHFCAPWFKMTRRAIRLAQSCGYSAAYLGESGFTRSPDKHPGEGIIEVPRLSERFIHRLP